MSPHEIAVSWALSDRRGSAFLSSAANIVHMPVRHELSINEPHRQRWNLIILLTMYAGYVAFMLCRNTLIAASPAIIEDPTLGLDKESYGQLMSWHSAGAIAGKLVTGIGADLIGGRATFLLALLLTAASNVAFGLVSALSMFKLFNFTGQFCKLTSPSSLTRVFSKNIEIGIVFLGPGENN